jgi:hypothetical protein
MKKEEIEWDVQLEIFKTRLLKVGVVIEISCNFPWIYLDSINGKRIIEKFQADHGFTIAFLPVRIDAPFHFTDLEEIFKLIRKYTK